MAQQAITLYAQDNLYDPGLRLVGGDDMNNVFKNLSTLANAAFLSCTYGITAHAGGGQALAYQLTSPVNQISVVGTAGDSVKLPPAAPGKVCIVMNSAALAADVYGYGASDTINGAAVYSLAAATMAVFACFTQSSGASAWGAL